MARSKASPPLPLSATKKERRPAAGLPPPTASEAAFERLLARFDELVLIEPEPFVPAEKPAAETAGEAAEFLEGLFANAAAYLERDRYATIGDSDELQYQNRRRHVRGASRHHRGPASRRAARARARSRITRTIRTRFAVRYGRFS